MRRMDEHGYTRQDVPDLFRFIDWVMVLPQEWEERFQTELARRFGSLPLWAEERLVQASPQELARWADRVLEAQQLDEIFVAE